LANSKDINSTERLLNVIRGSQQPSTPVTEALKDSSSPQKTPPKISLNFPGVFAGKHKVKVGIDIGQDNISFAKMAKTSDGKPMLVDQKIVKFDGQTNRESVEFRNLLRSSLVSFAGSPAACDVWAMMDATDVNIYHLKIPRVPKKQLENVIFFTAKKENPIEEKDVVFDYEMQGEITDQGIPKYSVMVYVAPRTVVEKVRGLFSSIGVDLAGITVAPFAIQNIFRTKWIAVGEGTFASLFIGNDFSRIDIYSKNNLVMTRGVKTGITSMMEAIDESVAETMPGKKMDKVRIKDILQELSEHPGDSIQDENGVHWSQSTILDMITPALERLIRQIDRTLEYYATSVGYEKAEKIYVSSVLSGFHQVLLNYISEQLATPTQLFDPFEGKHAAAAASLSFADKASLVPVIGLSLSDVKYTPNAIYTYLEKNKEIRDKMINRGIFAAFAAALVLCLAFIVFQVVEMGQLGAKRAKLEKELSLFQPLLSREKVGALVEETKSRYQVTKQYSQKYKGMALISELSSLTPEDIRLTSVRIAAPSGQAPAPKKDAPQVKETVQKEISDGVSIEGVVLGERNALDALLAQYVMNLERSAVLQGVTVEKSSIVNFGKKEILHFKINAKIG
jgi:Tfp pilus assembly PilM family ATPase